MVEVFKTNVNDQIQANMLVDQIHKNHTGYKANFDLEDCDKILRIKYVNGLIESSFVINLLNDFGFNAEVLPDDIPPVDPVHTSPKKYINKMRQEHGKKNSQHEKSNLINDGFIGWLH